LAALRLLGRREYTAEELRTRLLDRGYAEAGVALVLSELAADRSLDDRRVAAAHVRTASALKGRGRHRIQRELEARGIARDVIRDVLDAVPAGDEAALVERFLTRKRLPARLGPAERRRLFQQLLRRGFPTEAIVAALKRRGGSGDQDE
jgi:regulatory protein